MGIKPGTAVRKALVFTLVLLVLSALVSTNAVQQSLNETPYKQGGQLRFLSDDPRISSTPEELEALSAELAAEFERNVEMLACVIYQELGGDKASDEGRMMVGDTVLNRVEDPRFPNSIEEVLTAYRQFGTMYITGVVWPSRASDPREEHAVQRARDIARALLSGEHSKIYGQGYVWMAEFSQGTDVIYIDGTYFGR